MAKAKAKKENPEGRLKLKPLIPLAAKYLLPYDVDQEFTIDAKRGQEIVDNKDAVIVD